MHYIANVDTTSGDDKLLMTAKMNFLASTVPYSEFIVNLVAAVQNGSSIYKRSMETFIIITGYRSAPRLGTL